MCLLAYYDKLELGTQALANLALLPKVSEDRTRYATMATPQKGGENTDGSRRK